MKYVFDKKEIMENAWTLVREEALKYNNKEITLEQLENLEEQCPDISKTEALGSSSSHPGCDWYSIEFTDGSSIDVFVK